MSIRSQSSGDKAGSTAKFKNPAAMRLIEQAVQLDRFIRQAADDGESLDAVEQHAFDQVPRPAVEGR